MVQRKTFTTEELRAYTGQTIGNLIAPGLKVLFCGINPSLYSVATGHHFAMPKANVGPQQITIGCTRVWVLPNPSGLNAHYTPARFAEVFRELRLAMDEA
jgi:TDG/mug DNA glycosylase family protein